MGNINMKPIFNMFARKRKHKGTMWATLLGLGISAAVFAITRGNRKVSGLPIQNMVKRFSPKINPSLISNTAVTEFSEELLASALKNNDKNR